MRENEIFYAALTASRCPPSTAGPRRWFCGVAGGLDSAVLGEMFSYFVLPDAFVRLKTIPFRVNSISREGTRKKQQQITPTDIHCDSFRRYGDGFILISDKWHPPPSIFRSVEVCRSRQTVRPQESHASRQATLLRTNATLAHIDQGAICSPNLWSAHLPAGMMNMMDVETSICSGRCAARRVTNR